MARLKSAFLVSVFPVVFVGLAAAPCVAQAGKSAHRLGVEIAQAYTVPPENVGGSGGGGTDVAGLLVRVERLEDQVRQLNGQIQQLQFANQQLQTQLQKFEKDVEFRFQERGGKHAWNKHAWKMPHSHSAASSFGPGAKPGPVAGSNNADDAFDPTKNPHAPGAPRVLGTLPAAGPQGATGAGSAGAASNAPINLLSSPKTSGPAAAPGAGPVGGPAASATPPANPPGTAGLPDPTGTVIADAKFNSPKEQFDIALSYLRQKDYLDAQKSFSAFLAKNPKDHRVSDALYFLGEAYFRQGQKRRAAEQYLKISANYSHSPRAPAAMLRLGESLRALGAKEQACATFHEVARKYPRASAAIKAGAARAAKRAKC